MDIFMRDRLITFVDIIIRVPPLFIIDELLRIGLGLLDSDNVVLESTDFEISKVLNSVVNLIIPSILIPYDFECFVSEMHFILKFLCCCLGYVATVCMFLLWTKHLIIVYLYLISAGAVFISHWSNISTMKAIITYVGRHEATTSILDNILSLNLKCLFNGGPGFLIIQNYILQCSLASIFCYIHLGPRHPLLQKFLVLSFVAPSILSICPFPIQVLYHIPEFTTVLPLAVCKFVIWSNGITMLKIIYMSYQRAFNIINNYGLSALAETEWIRLNIPYVLRMFWMLRVGSQVFEILGNHYGEETFTYYEMIKILLANGCDTLITVLGMSSIISFICDYIGCICQWVLLTEDGNEKNIGPVSAILFYVLSLQTGLTSLDTEKRFVRLCRNFCLLLTVVLCLVFNIVNPLLMSLSASHNPALHRHLRALAVCVFLILFPVLLLVFLWSHYSISTWLLAVSVFSIEVIVKVLVSLAIYSLFLIDAYRSVFWEKLDDCVYIIRSFGNTVEFAFGIILFFNGFWILVFESGGTIRAVMICIHAYFNIWCEAKAGWSVFMKRRSAVYKINSLPEATAKQLRKLNDVCAICYHKMQSAKVTRCNHYFHSVCLRKWLYIQDHCPLCHNVLYYAESKQTNKSNEVIAAGQESEWTGNEGAQSSADQVAHPNTEDNVFRVYEGR